MIIFFRYTIVIATLLVIGCTRPFNQAEAIRSLKVLNSDMANMFLTADEMPEMAALRYLWNQPTAPLPFPNEKFTFEKPYLSYNFEEAKGIYLWDTLIAGFVKQSDDEAVSISFTGNTYPNAHFRITKFESLPISSRPDFPVKMEAVLLIEDNPTLKIQYSASVEDELPLQVNTTITGREYKIAAAFSRTRSGDTGTLSSQITLNYETDQIIDFRLNAAIGYSSMGYYFEKINFDILLFRHTITGNIDYDMINPTAEDYATSFNAHANIEIFERPMKRKVGNIVLAVVNDGELLDYHIKFRNNEQELLSEFLPIINKILHIKL